MTADSTADDVRYRPTGKLHDLPKDGQAELHTEIYPPADRRSPIQVLTRCVVQ